MKKIKKKKKKKKEKKEKKRKKEKRNKFVSFKHFPLNFIIIKYNLSLLIILINIFYYISFS